MLNRGGRGVEDKTHLSAASSHPDEVRAFGEAIRPLPILTYIHISWGKKKNIIIIIKKKQAFSTPKKSNKHEVLAWKNVPLVTCASGPRVNRGRWRGGTATHWDLDFLLIQTCFVYGARERSRNMPVTLPSPWGAALPTPRLLAAIPGEASRQRRLRAAPASARLAAPHIWLKAVQAALAVRTPARMRIPPGEIPRPQPGSSPPGIVPSPAAGRTWALPGMGAKGWEVKGWEVKGWM